MGIGRFTSVLAGKDGSLVSINEICFIYENKDSSFKIFDSQLWDYIFEHPKQQFVFLSKKLEDIDLFVIGGHKFLRIKNPLISVIKKRT